MPTTYIIEQGAELVCDGECLAVHKDEAMLQSLPLIKLDQIVIVGNVGISTPAIKRVLDRNIDVIFVTQRGRFHGKLIGRTSPHVALRHLQYRRADDPAWMLETARALVRGKLHNCRALLQRYRRDRVAPPPELTHSIDALGASLQRVERVRGRSALMGVEGFGTQRYFAGLRAIIAEEWGFAGRVRRPPTDPVNVLLSLGYTLLLANVLGALEMVGLDPFLGYLHTTAYNRPSLALDLMEEFRPVLVDTVVVQAVRTAITSDDFTVTDDAERPVMLSDAGKRAFVRAFEERMQTLVQHPEGRDSGPGQVDYRRCIALQARRMARAVQRGAIYQPFTIR
jgi:CRISPR-associated protein Cas1